MTTPPPQWPSSPPPHPEDDPRVPSGSSVPPPPPQHAAPLLPGAPVPPEQQKTSNSRLYPAGSADPLPDTGDGRPSWGPIDVFLGVLYVATIALVIGGVVAAIVTAIGGGDLGVELPIYALFAATLVQQIAQGTWPWVVSRWKGVGMARDWGFRILFPKDLGHGVLLAIVCVFAAGITNQVVARLVGLDDPSTASNTDILSDNQSSLWIIGIILVVTIGAPLTEELLFRGVFLRALEKSFGVVVGVIGSTFLFALPHAQGGATWQETAVLLSSIFVIGLVFAMATVRTGRLAPAIIGHLVFNTFGTVATLLG